mmetsp:Transcript_26176/g.43309  ORF Transcript_26176/g.43309 Transcript_26176/m.43309 type:complete len:497 (-) Transcript_26176:358-1848(-)
MASKVGIQLVVGLVAVNAAKTMKKLEYGTTDCSDTATTTLIGSATSCEQMCLAGHSGTLGTGTGPSSFLLACHTSTIDIIEYGSNNCDADTITVAQKDQLDSCQTAGSNSYKYVCEEIDASSCSGMAAPLPPMAAPLPPPTIPPPMPPSGTGTHTNPGTGTNMNPANPTTGSLECTCCKGSGCSLQLSFTGTDQLCNADSYALCVASAPGDCPNPSKNEAGALNVQLCSSTRKYSHKEESSSSDPCFARTDTHACLLHGEGVTAASAFSQCFLGHEQTTANRVLMSSLKAGDIVLSDAQHATGVVVNQHARVERAAQMLTLHHSGGQLTLTPDHVLYLDGAWLPARAAKAGSRLSNGLKVTAITFGTQAIINPITASGSILAAGPNDQPIVAATANEWLSDILLSGYPKYTLSFKLASAYPALVQAYYDAVLEPFFTLAVPRLKQIKTALPMPVLASGLVVGDVLLAVGLFAFSFGKLALAAAVVAGLVPLLAHKM